MKSLVIAAAAVALCAGSFALVHADDMGGMPMPTTMPTTKPMTMNTMCPVSGDPVNPKITVNYEGKTIGFCCADCVKEFNADPAKYMAKMK